MAVGQELLWELLRSALRAEGANRRRLSLYTKSHRADLWSAGCRQRGGGQGNGVRCRGSRWLSQMY